MVSPASRVWQTVANSSQAHRGHLIAQSKIFTVVCDVNTYEKFKVNLNTRGKLIDSVRDPSYQAPLAKRDGYFASGGSC